MEFGFTYQELVLLIISSFTLLGILIAALNLDYVNSIGISYLSWTKKSYGNTSGFKKFLLGFFRLPSYLGEITSHEGWKAGLSILGLGLTILLYAAIVLLIGLLLIGIWPVLKWIIIIIVILIVIGMFSK
jgi:hypothetical protein